MSFVFSYKLFYPPVLPHALFLPIFLSQMTQHCWPFVYFSNRVCNIIKLFLFKYLALLIIQWQPSEIISRLSWLIMVLLIYLVLLILYNSMMIAISPLLNFPPYSLFSDIIVISFLALVLEILIRFHPGLATNKSKALRDGVRGGLTY